ncbi:glycosyltransferase family 4 protein [Amycolatopsis rhizosphaerae]|uniref:Glycosyltransferase family 4 protein n=1 Tax=Amycolatopsis rhizosphaerae TaxID=2053003 RepID=A0A558D2T1_9PSEU|nr:glycosyltransferase family 4 protein [Amycolatopsis rhizosphaerae]TVT55322.1 glycosyltransferase family 4 protein [Amycolatopsis rhizosphaerae]
MTAIRVLHIPGRTPYARKLRDYGVQILNDTTVDGLVVPRDATLAWLLEHRPWDWLDVVHLHHPDFEPIPRLRAVLAECRRAGKRVVFTAHDVRPVFGDRAAHHGRMRVLAENGVPFVCLTPGAEIEVRRRFRARTVMIPHGYVAVPDIPARSTQRDRGPTRFLIYGSLRRNRDVELVLSCWRFARRLSETTLHLLLRAPSRVSLLEDAEAWGAIREHSADLRLRVDVLPFPSDAEVQEAVAGTDCLLLPYRWASHSGQLEHALDVGVLPVATRTGYLPDQVSLHDGLVAEPVWFDWSGDAPFDHGARLLEAMQTAHAAIQGGWQSHDAEKFAEHRRREHTEVVASYRALYEGGR